MKKLRLVSLAVGSILIAGSAVLVACSDDTTINPTIDGAAPDTGTIETSTPDTGTDVDASDSSDFDAGLTLQAFRGDVGAAVCDSVARCCYGSATLAAGAPVDGGTYNQAACLTQFTNVGFEGSNTATAVELDAGNVALDQAKAIDCLAKVTALTCDLGATEYQAARAACFGAYVGKLADAAPCRSSVECSPNSFCLAAAPSSDGTPVGTCAPLRAVGASCGDFTTLPDKADEACTYRQSGIPDQHCDSTNPDLSLKPQDEWVCASNVAVGSFCRNSDGCSAGICTFTEDESSLVCASPVALFEQAACGAFVTPPP